MPEVTVFLAWVVTLLLGYLLLKNFFNRLPPGPWGLPFFGCWPWMSNFWHVDFTKLGKGYGDIFTVYLLNTPVVVLNGTKAIQEAFYNNPNNWAGRPYSHGFVLHQINPENLFKDDYSQKFKARKKFAMANLKKFGYGMPRIQERIQGEIDATMEVFRSHRGKPFSLQEAIWIHGANVIPAILFDRTFESDDQSFLKVLEDTDKWFTEVTPTCEADVMPILRFFPRKCVTKGLEATKRLVTWFTGAIAKRRAEYNPNDVCSFVDLCIKNDCDNAEILNYIFSFWGDGTDTTVGSIRWWFYYMAHNPEYQAKAQHEVDQVLAGRQPTQADKKNLQYLEATLMETLRMTTPVPQSLPLKTTADVDILGYKIPKNTIFFANWMAMHKDPALFENPDVFNPDRFMLEDGTCDIKNKGWAGFALGKRSCIGEPLARQVMFHFFANSLQKFTFSYPDGEAPSRNFADLALPGVVSMPADFKIVATPR